MRGAAKNTLKMIQNKKISTHAPHARRGAEKLAQMTAEQNFYSRASCEARRLMSMNLLIYSPFLLTRLMRGAAIL